MYTVHAVYYVDYYGYSTITYYPPTFHEAMHTYQRTTKDEDLVKVTLETPKNTWVTQKLNNGTMEQLVHPKPEWAR